MTDERETNEQWAPPEHGSEKGALQKRVARGLTWTFIDTWGGQFIQLFIFAILAHLLTKVDFGLVALASVFVQFAQLFVDQGLGDALIQRKTVTRVQIDTAFWVAVVTGLALMVIGIVLAEPIAILVNQPGLAPIIAVLSINFLVVSLSSVQLALLRRDMRFRSLAVRRLVAVAVGGVIGVVAAQYLNWGAWSLVAQQVSYGVVSVGMLWTVSPWRPGLHWNTKDFRELFSFGMNIVGSDVLNFISRNSDNLLVGAVLGAGPLGLYAIGYKILDTTQTLLVNAARKLAVPGFLTDPERPRTVAPGVRPREPRGERDHHAGLHRAVARGVRGDRRAVRRPMGGLWARRRDALPHRTGADVAGVQRCATQLGGPPEHCFPLPTRDDGGPRRGIPDRRHRLQGHRRGRRSIRCRELPALAAELATSSIATAASPSLITSGSCAGSPCARL